MQGSDNIIEKAIENTHQNMHARDAKNWFSLLIQPEQYVGELFSVNYETAKVQIHDFERKKVGGIPSLCFLIATRISPNSESVDFQSEDASIILLRVKDSTPLPHDADAERIRVETAQRISGSTDTHWDYKDAMDAKTRVLLGYAGIECRIIGTFFLDLLDENNSQSKLGLKFGCDISNYYPNRGLKVYKPNGEALENIVNFIDAANLNDHHEKYGTTEKVSLGQIRYASTNRKYQNVDNVPVYIYPADLLAQKTALFGMTRTGKSNTTKIIAKSVYELRYPENPKDKFLRIGQIIFDPNGEYANENVQDADGKSLNANALKNIWKIKSPVLKNDEVATYGITSHPEDPDRKLMLLNFYLDDNLQEGKEIINATLANTNQVKYITNFMQVSFDNRPSGHGSSELTRYLRKVLVYRAILNKAGFKVPDNLSPRTKKLFNRELIKALRSAGQEENDAEFESAAIILEKEKPTWNELSKAFEVLERFIRSNNEKYKSFETWYVSERPKASGDTWADDDFKKLLGIFEYKNGTRLIGQVIPQHSSLTSADYADDIYMDLVAGKLVIIDQSMGDSELNSMSAKRIISRIFEKNKERFIKGEIPPDIIVYAEEAHNILPPDSEKDYKDIWVRTAKEGAKLRIGLVYITQEVSSIQKNILKNTANWFICHLNNTDETRELCKFYDFKDFEPSIRRAQDKGFVRVKTLSNYFVIPVQVKKFDVLEGN